MKSALSIEEQEVHVNFGRLDDRAQIYVSDLRYITKLDKLVEKSPEWAKDHEEYLKSTGELVGITYSCPIEFISFRTMQRKPNITDEQRQEMAKRIRENIHGKK